MIWVALAFVAAIATSIGALIEKKTLFKEHAMEFTAVFSIFVMILSLPLFFLVDFSRLDLFSVGILFVMSIFDTIGFLLIAKSIRHMEISAVSHY